MILIRFGFDHAYLIMQNFTHANRSNQQNYLDSFDSKLTNRYIFADSFDSKLTNRQLYYDSFDS